MEPISECCEDLVVLLNAHATAADKAPTVEDRVRAADAACAYYQGVGICELLLDAEVDAFFHHFIRSAQSRRWVLQQRPGPLGTVPSVSGIMKASNTRGLFAAMAAGQWRLAEDIARLSPDAWSAADEYEDDFCYASFLHGHLLGAAHDQLDAILARFEKALEGGEAVRRDLCRALLAKEASALLAAFDALIAERDEHLAKLRQGPMCRDSLFTPFASVYVEGLAWLALLERAGVATPAEVDYCPALVRTTAFAPFVPSSFPGLPLEG
ncbi:MAG: Imm49 family immunity protein [Anaeromyxobacter sp.]